MLTVVLSLAVAVTADRPMAGHSLVYSAREKAVLEIDGDAAGPSPIRRWDGKSWLAIPKSELPARSLAAVAADEQGNVLVHGGAVGTARPDGSTDFKVTIDTWWWDGKSWTKVSSKGPAARDHHAMVYDSVRRCFVLFGGSDADPSGRSTFFGDTWEWGGSEWKKVAGDGPSARCHHAMAYDPVRKISILVGGYGPNGADDRTWAWDGKSWSVIGRGTPADRSSPRLAWDSKAGRILLFGGESADKTPSDTWAFDGKSWSQVAREGPPGRTVHALAFDPDRNVAIVYGGAAGNDVLGDTWEFRAGRWSVCRP